MNVIEDTIGRLWPAFRADFWQRESERMKFGERIIWAGNVAHAGIWTSLGLLAGGHFTEKPLVGYWLLTSERFVRVWFEPWSRPFLKEKHRELFEAEWRIVNELLATLKKEELRSRTSKEVASARIVDVSANVLRWKHENLDEIHVSIREQADGFGAVIYDPIDAKRIYEILRALARKNNAGDGDAREPEPKLLEELYRLHREGVLTSDEYETKKKEILDRV